MTLIVPTADFIRAWRSAKSVREVAVATGLAPSTIRNRASRLRAAGVAMPDLRKLHTMETVRHPYHKRYREQLVREGLCRVARSHGPATHGQKCEHCYLVHAGIEVAA